LVNLLNLAIRRFKTYVATGFGTQTPGLVRN